MYVPPSANPAELGDIDVITHNGKIRLFHLTLPGHDLVSCATSTDGLSWEPAPPAIHTGPPGSCDDDMIWTMHTVQRPDGRGFHMYYTACALKEHGQVQRVALATSEDLETWTKHAHNPILEAAPPHYNAHRDLVGFVSFRDPFVFLDDDGTWHMLVTGRTSRGPRFRRGSIAHAVSRDGIAWELRPPLYAPGQFEDMEVPALVRLGSRYYLFFHDFAGHSLYRMADSLEGPWRAPLRDQVLPDSNAVTRFCVWKGTALVYTWVRGPCDWRRRGPSQGCAALAPPKEVQALDSGELVLRSFDGWGAWHDGAAVPLPPLEAPEHVHGQRLALHGSEWADFVLDATFQLDAGRAIGFGFRADPGVETLNWLRFNYHARTVELQKHVPYDSSMDRFKLRKTTVQSMPAPLEHGRPVRLRMIACRQYVEVSLDDVVHLSAVTYAAQRGRVGPFIEDGRGRLTDIVLRPLRSPWRD